MPSNMRSAAVPTQNVGNGPVLYFYASALLWLLAGTALSLLASVQSWWPGLFADIPWLTFGRIRPAAWDLLGYGWSSLAGMGTALWIASRLSKVKIGDPVVLILAATLWNAGVLFGTIGILSGQGTSLEWLEFPKYAALILLTAYFFIGVMIALPSASRSQGTLYISQWYLIAAVFVFPWTYGTAGLLSLCHPVQGVLQAVVTSWYGNNFLGLWLGALALAAAYYIISQATERTIPRYSLALKGFLLFVLFTGWNGAGEWLGGPVPAWLQTVSVIAGVSLAVPLAIIAMNLLPPVTQNLSAAKREPALGFMGFGVAAFLLAGAATVLCSFRVFDKISHFTYAALAHKEFFLFGALMMIFLGAILFVTARISGGKKISPLVRAAFWLTALGSLLMAGALKMSGLIQAFAFAKGNVPFVQIAQDVQPYLVLWSAALLAVLLGQCAFILHFAGCLKKGTGR